MDEVRSAIRRYLEDNFIMGTGGAPLADGDSFLEHHVLDSTGFLELIGHLEDAYEIKVKDEEMMPENLDSVDNIVRFLARKHGSAG